MTEHRDDAGYGCQRRQRSGESKAKQKDGVGPEKLGRALGVVLRHRTESGATASWRLAF